MSLSQEDRDFLRDEKSRATTHAAVAKRTAKAKAAHDIWSAWMRWQFQCGQMNADGSFTIPKEKVDRWQRQMTTEFEALPAEEQKSDYQVADEFMGGF